MKLPRYPVQQLDEFSYQFFSRGPRGEFEMRVSLDPMRENLFNLGFGVWNTETLMLDDLMLLRNNDMDVILSTVSIIAFNFLDSNPGSWIMATGSTAARTRKYQMGIAKYKDEVMQDYKILGLTCERDQHGNIVGDFPEWFGAWHDFDKGSNYDAFLISRFQ